MQQQEVCTISSIVFVRYVDPHLQCVSHVHPLLPPSAKGTQINSMYQKDMPLSAMIALLVLGAIPKSGDLHTQQALVSLKARLSNSYSSIVS